MDTFSIQIYKRGMLEYIGLNPGLQIQPPTGINFYSKTKIFLKISQYFFWKKFSFKEKFLWWIFVVLPWNYSISPPVYRTLCTLQVYLWDLRKLQHNESSFNHFSSSNQFWKLKKMLFQQKISKSVLKQTVMLDRILHFCNYTFHKRLFIDSISKIKTNVINIFMQKK